MELTELIKARRSIGKMKPDPVDKAVVEQLLDVAVSAPNHRNTEPWRFIVLEGAGRDRIAQGMQAIKQDEIIESGMDPETEDNKMAVKKAGLKAYRAPVIIAAILSPSNHKLVPLIEEYAATHAAVQNMLLAAHALGLGAIWRTGSAAYHPLMKSQLGLNQNEQIVGFVYVGYPDMVPAEAKRTPFQQKTTWISN